MITLRYDLNDSCFKIAYLKADGTIFAEYILETEDDLRLYGIGSNTINSALLIKAAKGEL